jgi:uncharacterized protein involved in exopolysaccharide biosynthesis
MSGVHTTANDVDVDLGRLFSSLLERWARVVIVALIVTAVAFVLAWLTTPLYHGETRLLIETRESVFTRPEASNSEGYRPILVVVGVTSMVLVIGSTEIFKQGARVLNLSSLP